MIYITYLFSISFLLFSFLPTDYFIVIVHLFIFYFFVSFLLIMTFDLKAQPASISSAICGLRRIIVVFSSLMEKWKKKMEKIYLFIYNLFLLTTNCSTAVKHYKNMALFILKKKKVQCYSSRANRAIHDSLTCTRFILLGQYS